MRESARRQTVDAAEMRSKNRVLLLDLIWREQRISRAEISRRTGLSPSTVSDIVRDLERAGLVRDIGTGSSRGGRRPILVGFCDDAHAIVGVELGAKHIAVALTDLRGRVQVFREVQHPVRTDPRGSLATTKALVDDCLRTGGVALPRLLGIGVAVPSPIDPRTPGHMSPRIVPAWAGYDIRAWLGEHYACPVSVDNDANLGALAEQWWGERADDLTYIKVGMGVGAGHIIRGELYRGADGSAGEIGHVLVDSSGPPCMCGSHGCLVMMVGSDALIARARETMRVTDEPLAIATIVAQAQRGDAAAQDILTDAGRYLGIALSSLVNILNPAVVVLGGALAAAGDLLVEPLHTSIHARALSRGIARTRIVASTQGSRSIAVGAATLVLAAALRDHTLFPRLTGSA